MTQTTIGGPAGEADADRRLSNAEIAVTFLRLAAAGHAREAWMRFGSPDFRHHNPFFAGDGETLITAMDENAQAHPDKVLEVIRTISEEPFVAVHTTVRQDRSDRGTVVVHLFRIEEGRIREFWDVAQEIPADSPNQYGMI